MDYPFQPVAFTRVTVDNPFWSPRLQTNREITIPYTFRKSEETGRIDNFAKAAGRMAGPHVGIFYNDSDVFKVIEGASFSLSLYPDPDLDAYLDRLIDDIAAAQEPDGYLYTARSINPQVVTDDKEGLTRWSNLRVSHELYNVGHLYEAAVAHYQATGKRTLLNVALKNADLVDSVFGSGKKRDVPGHQEIEIGLVKLYRLTGNGRYLQLAKFFLDERGQAHGRKLYENHGDVGYMQDHLPVTKQHKAVGHAVRAAYMYSGMADVAAITGDKAYLEALDHLWENVVSRKMYLTGGIGARHQGEAFGDDYELPNLTAYAETCAAIANVMWNHRMFLLHGDAKYMDVVERVLYNGLLAGVSLGGNSFFYPNPLESDGRWQFNKNQAASRSPWFDCSCCPTNIVRFLPSLPGYAYAVRNDVLYVSLFLGGSSTVELNGTAVHVTQETAYPWHGQIKLVVTPDEPTDFVMAIRIPGWAQNQPVPSDLYRYLGSSSLEVGLRVNGETTPFSIENGFAHLRRRWSAGDEVELSLPMPIRRVLSNEQVTNNDGKVAVERGPLVYCAEGIDNGGSLSDLALPDDAVLSAHHEAELLGGISTIQSSGVTLVPYFAWSHRGVGEMQVWMKRGM